jgi:RNA polymerase sigma-70 factor (ECF subfamily)
VYIEVEDEDKVKMEEETIILNDLRQHKPAACQRLFAVYGPMVFRMVQRIVTCNEDAEEVYQDVFFKALRSIESYDSRQSSLATWLNRIAYHESLNFVRGKKPHIVYMDDRDMGAGTPDDAPDDGPQNEEVIQRLEQALSMLPPHEQAIVSMFYYDNMSLADIAFVTGSITSTVGSQLSRIRKKLYRIIKTL